jgi:hypothetical protein
MLLQKTEKARLELLPGARKLSLRERSLLLLVEGKPLPDLQAMYNGLGAQMVENLARQGYLTGLHPPGAGASPSARTTSRAPSIQRPEPGDTLRTLAGARMYLFDTCERLFARRSPALAQQFRDALRAAKDRASMLEVGNAMFAEVALAASGDRAASLREKFEQLLPLEKTPTERA